MVYNKVYVAAGQEKYHDKHAAGGIRWEYE